MIEYIYRLEVGNKCICLNDIEQRIYLENRMYTPMKYDKAKAVANEIGLEVVKVYEIKNYSEETKRLVSTKIFD